MKLKNIGFTEGFSSFVERNEINIPFGEVIEVTPKVGNYLLNQGRLQQNAREFNAPNPLVIVYEHCIKPENAVRTIEVQTEPIEVMHEPLEVTPEVAVTPPPVSVKRKSKTKVKNASTR